MKSLRFWRNRYRKNKSGRNLKNYLRAKAKLGIWDRRYCQYSGCSPDVSSPVKSFIMRGYAAGLIPTFTIEGQHAATSYHKLHRAADLGLRKGEIGTKRGMDKMVKFQRSEFKNFHKHGLIELIGPDNNATVLRGNSTRLAEGAPLETMHDNHVHGAG